MPHRWWIRNGVRVNQMKKHEKRGGHIFEHCLPLCCMSPSSVLIHRHVFDEWAFLTRHCRMRGLRLLVAFLCQISGLIHRYVFIKKYGGHEDQLSRKHWGMDRFRIRALEKLLASHVLSTEQVGQVQTMLYKKAKIYAQGARKRGREKEALYYEAKIGCLFHE